MSMYRIVFSKPSRESGSGCQLIPPRCCVIDSTLPGSTSRPVRRCRRAGTPCPSRAAFALVKLVKSALPASARDLPTDGLQVFARSSTPWSSTHCPEASTTSNGSFQIRRCRRARLAERQRQPRRWFGNDDGCGTTNPAAADKLIIFLPRRRWTSATTASARRRPSAAPSC